MNDAETREVTVLRAERTVQDFDIADQLRAEALQLSEISLTVTLSALVLLHIVYQDLQPSVYAAVIQVVTKTPNFERLAAAFVLADINPGVERLNQLVVSSE